MAELSAKELLEQMINGTHVTEEVEQEELTEADTEDTATAEEADNTVEDTDQETDTEENEETNEENDDSANETSDAAEEGQEEHTQDDAGESEDESEATEEINYKEFYEKVALAKFTANGREVEGFKNPEDLIRAQQMLHGYSDKMKVFKEYKPFIKTLEERGITADPEKFKLAMSLLDGDPEAIKKVLKDKNIDPLELDLDDIKYVPKVKLPSEAQLLIEETYEQAENLGVGSKFNRVISKDWDVPSLQEFVRNGAVRADLLQHLKDGTYDIVQNEIKRMELLDSTGVLDGMNSVEKYRAAIANLQRRVPTTPAKKVVAPTGTAVDKTAETKKAAEEAEFKRKAAEKEQEIAEQRRLAASVSKKKPVSKPKPEPKLEELKGDAFRAEFRKMLMS